MLKQTHQKQYRKQEHYIRILGKGLLSIGIPLKSGRSENLFSISTHKITPGVRVVYRVEGRTLWCLDTDLPDTVVPCFYEFLSFYPNVNGAVIVTG